MQAVKVSPKGQITLPKKIRKHLNIKAGDALVVERKNNEIVLKKGKTIHDYIATLPKPKVSIEKIVEKSIEEAIKDRV